MIMTLQEVMDTCHDWLEFCQKKGFSEYSINEGGEDVQVILTTQEAHDLGIVRLSEWKRVKPNTTLTGEEPK